LESGGPGPDCRGHRSMYSVEEFINKKTIIVGEVKTGKTAHLEDLLHRLLGSGYTDITVIDMAPALTRGIGGKMSLNKLKSIRYWTADIRAPRLEGGSADEVEALAKDNVRLIDHILSQHFKNPSKVLIINDVSIYLQAGELDKLLSLLNSTPTVIMNGYFGRSLGGGRLGERERENMKALQEKCDKVIFASSLPKPAISPA
jgi:hypothetical protein